jgi:hypothetical protein
MKKKILSILGIIVIIVLLFSIVTIKYKNDHIYDKYSDLLNNNLEFLSSLVKGYSNSGHVDVTANYRGAHGENNPHNFNYLFNVDDSKLIVGNEDGYSYLSDFIYLDLLNRVSSIKDTLKVTQIKDGLYNIDTKVISNLLFKKIDSITLEVKTKGFVKKIDESILHIKYDDKEETITFNEDFTSARGTFFDKEVKYNKTSQGISLQYGVDFKMNIFIRDNYLEYNVVDDEYVYKLSLYDDKIIANVSGDASIYRGLDMTFNFAGGLRIEPDKIVDSKNICITRYFNALGRVGSEY